MRETGTRPYMNFDNIENIRNGGFGGFRAISELQTHLEVCGVPKEPGVYFVVRPGRTRPDFLSESTGGHFKRKDPTVEVGTLMQNWVEDAIVLYIGKTSTLKTRLKALCDFGQGKPVGHWGGRYIWQLRDSCELLVCWKVTPDAAPEFVESGLLREFVALYGKRPFANLRD